MLDQLHGPAAPSVCRLPSPELREHLTVPVVLLHALWHVFRSVLVGFSLPPPEAPRDEVRRPTVFDDVTFTPLERAEGVEQTLQDSAADRRRQIEEAEGR
jgi:hypothetical protein